MENRNTMVEQNLSLIYFTIDKFFANRKGFYNRDDLFQVGSLGLIRAVEKFDETKGVSFSTYAVATIRFYIENYMQKESKFERDEPTKITKETEDLGALEYQKIMENEDLVVKLVNNANLSNLQINAVVYCYKLSPSVVDKLVNYVPIAEENLRRRNITRTFQRAINKIKKTLDKRV